MRFFRRVITSLVLSLTSIAAQSVGADPGRALPLHVHPVSRAATHDGYFAPTFALSDDYFDGRDSRTRVRRHLAVLKQAGVTHLRCAFSWNGIEPEQGKFDFKFWDMLVDEATRAGVEVMPYVAYTPKWAARKEQLFWEQPPADFTNYARTMKTLAAHFRGRIRSWEIWNEPDLQEYWQGTPDEFAGLVKLAAPAIREGNPDAVIVLGGMSHGPGEFFERLVNQHHIERWVDVIAMHGYPESRDEDPLSR